MKLFGSFFEGRGASGKNSLPWKVLQESHQLDAITMESFQAPVLIYKHSTRCGISSVVLSRMERNNELQQAALSFYFLDLIRYRNISQKVAAVFGVRHESPQVILIIEGRVIWHGSHGEIEPETILKRLP